jgi:hypothetical protein
MQTDSAPNTEPVAEEQPGAEPDNTTGYEDDDFGQADSFPRDYVERLRKENAGYRQKGKDAEERSEALAKRLHTALVAVTGRLQAAEDLPFDAAHLDDPDKLSEAIDAILTERPHLKARKVTGDVGQGERDTAETFDLAAALRARA